MKELITEILLNPDKFSDFVFASGTGDNPYLTFRTLQFLLNDAKYKDMVEFEMKCFMEVSDYYRSCVIERAKSMQELEILARKMIVEKNIKRVKETLNYFLEGKLTWDNLVATF